ncbi:DUF3224 domain-containing protein [Streptomyces sp. NPDC048357]|uniref:DUF3224 domain-containing protein n=1 Tax=Streptomyces sp. NPDC048357 TaxID=3154719 RepID=UPI003429EAC0
MHSATTTGSERTAEFFTIVPSSGTGELTGISGAGAWRSIPTVRTGSGTTTGSAELTLILARHPTC